MFDIHDLDESIRTLSMKVILETLQQRVKKNHELGRPTYVYIDEIYLLLKDQYSEQFLYEFWKWCRKFGAVVTGITQNVTELLCSQQASTMLSNSEFCIMLGQSQNDVANLKDLFRLSNMEEEELLWANKGEGLIKFGSTVIPFENHFPKNTELYRIWNTDPSEKEGLSAELSIDQPAEESIAEKLNVATLPQMVNTQESAADLDDSDQHEEETDRVVEPGKTDLTVSELPLPKKLEDPHPYYLENPTLEPPVYNRNWDEY